MTNDPRVVKEEGEAETEVRRVVKGMPRRQTSFWRGLLQSNRYICVIYIRFVSNSVLHTGCLENIAPFH